MSPVITVNELGIRYPGNSEWTLKALSLQVEASEFVALVGGSGVGKSTLLRVIADLLPVMAGNIDMPQTIDKGQRQRALVFHDGRLLPWLTVRENIRFGLQGLSLSKAQQNERIDEVLDLTNLEELDDRWPHQLSGGQAQRVGIALALAAVKPTILLMDEPFSAVDALTRRVLQAELSRIWSQSDAFVSF